MSEEQFGILNEVANINNFMELSEEERKKIEEEMKNKEQN